MSGFIKARIYGKKGHRRQWNELDCTEKKAK